MKNKFINYFGPDNMNSNNIIEYLKGLISAIKSTISIIITFLGLLYLFVMGLITGIKSFWGSRVKNKILISKDLSIVMFSSHYLQFSLAPLSIFLSSTYYNYGLVALTYVSFFLFILLFILTSQSFIQLIFNIHESLLQLEEIINKYFCYLIKNTSGKGRSSAARAVSPLTGPATKVSASPLSNMAGRVCQPGQARFYSSQSSDGSGGPPLSISKEEKVLNQVKNIADIVGGGYKSYNVIESLGVLESLVEGEELQERIQEYLDRLSDNTTYSLISVIRWINSETGFSDGIATGVSLKITKNVSSYLLSKKIRMSLFSSISRYGLSDSECELVLMSREWLNLDEFNGSLKDITRIVNEELINEVEKKAQKMEIDIKKRINYSNEYSDIVMDKYGEAILKNDKIIGYKLNEKERVIVKSYMSEQGDPLRQKVE